MSAELFRKIAAQRQKVEDERAAIRQDREERNRKYAEFSEAWHKVYAYPQGTPEPSIDDYRQSIQNRLVLLGPYLFERFWDFILAELASLSDVDENLQMAATLLLNAAFNNRAEVQECLAAC